MALARPAPAGRAAARAPLARRRRLGSRVPAGPFALGAGADGFAYDNERPAPRASSSPPSGSPAARSPTRRGCAFAEGGGYERREWWTDEGWAWKEEYDITRLHAASATGHPDAPGRATCPGSRPTPSPARTARGSRPRPSGRRRRPGRRLDGGAAGTGVSGSGRRRSSPATRASSPTPTASTPRSSSTRGYRVLRGGSWATHPRVATPTFRNWDLPAAPADLRRRAAGPRPRRPDRMEPARARAAETASSSSRSSAPGDERTLADDVLDGLTRPFKELPPKHFYDARGAELFDRICELPEYYPTRAERAILVADAARRSSRAPAPAELVELGSGTAAKTRVLLARAARRRARCAATCRSTSPRRWCARSARASSSRSSPASSARHRRRLRAPPRRASPPPATAARGSSPSSAARSATSRPAARRRFLRSLARAAAARRRPPAARHRPRQGPGGARGRLRRRGRRHRRVQPQRPARRSTASSTPTSTSTPSSTSRSSTASASGSRCGCAPQRRMHVHVGALGLDVDVRRARGAAHRDQREVHAASGSSGDLAAAGLALERVLTDADGLFALSLCTPRR